MYPDGEAVPMLERRTARVLAETFDERRGA
jgi:hypothetical protein